MTKSYICDIMSQKVQKRSDKMKNIYKCKNGIIIVIPEGAEVDFESIATATAIINPLDDLTKRQREIIEMVISGASNKAIASELYISIGTVKRIIYNSYRALGVNSRVELIRLVNAFNY